MSDLQTLDAPTGFDGGLQDLSDQSPAGPACEKCQAPLPNQAMAACPSCGWYASAGVYVEVAPEWEQACSGQSPTGQQPSMLQVWSTLIPAWGWILIGTALAVAVGSLAIRLTVVAEDAALHTLWGVSQLAAGLLVLAVCHLLVFFMAASTDPDMGVLDLVVNPARAWLRLCAKLPNRFWVLNTANLGLTAALSAVLIIGGIPYNDIWNWGIKPPAKKSLLGAIEAKAAPTDMSMEEAMDQFAQNAAIGAGEGANPLGGQPSEATGEVKRQTIDALILGYELTPQGSIDRLLLATEHNGRLLYAGRVRPKLDEEEAAQLPAKLQAARAPRPIINVPGSATWVQPKFTCRVTYHKRVESGMLQGIIWEELLGEVDLPTAP